MSGDEARDEDGGGPRRLTLAVTGGTGLVGRALLAAAGGARDVCAVRALCRTAQAPSRGTAPLRGIEWVRGDLGDRAALGRLCAGADVLIHVAGATAATGDRGFHAVNVAGTARAVAAARDAGCARVVVVSSQAAGAPGLSRYAASKAMGEAAARRAAKGAAGDAMTVRIVRPPAVFGPGDEATKPILDALSRGVLPVPGGRGWRERRFALITADDLAQALLRAAREGDAGVSVPASWPALSWSDLAGAAGRPVRLVPVPLSVLGAAGRCADAWSRVTGKPLVFGRGKAREMARDWRASGSGLANLSLSEALTPLLSPRPASPSPQGKSASIAAPVTEGSP